MKNLYVTGSQKYETFMGTWRIVKKNIWGNIQAKTEDASIYALEIEFHKKLAVLFSISVLLTHKQAEVCMVVDTISVRQMNW